MDGLLPNEIRLLIFLKLPIDQILKCKLVCKDWFSLIKVIKLKNLVLSETKSTVFSEKWFCGTNEQVSNLHQINDFDTFKKINLNQTLFSNLKNLFIYRNVYQYEDQIKFNLFKQINMLKNLQKLAIIDVRFPYKFRRHHFSLNLSNLKSFTIICEKETNIALTLDTPSLEFLKLDYLSSLDCEITLIHPKKIRILEICDNLDFIKDLTNLERLYIERTFKADKDFVLNYPKLKELHFLGFRERRCLFRIIEQKQELNRQNLAIFYNGVKIDYVNDLSINELLIEEDRPLYDYGLQSSRIEFYKNNQDKLANRMPFVKRLNYNRLVDHFDSVLRLNQFLNRLINLNDIWVFGEIDLNLFIQFLNKSNACFQNFTFCSISLDQDFFDCHLLSLAHGIKRLDIVKKRKLNYRFLLNDAFDGLQKIQLEEELPNYLIADLILKLKYLRCFEFLFKNLRTNVDLRELKIKKGETERKYLEKKHLIFYFFKQNRFDGYLLTFIDVLKRETKKAKKLKELKKVEI